MNLLTEEFLSKYPNMPEHMNELGQFVFYRTYSRWLPKQNRRETWKEAVARAVDYNVSISINHFKNIKTEVPVDKIKVEAETLFDNVFNLRQFLSGRTHWVGGAESSVAEKFPLANFNCSFIDVTAWEDLCDMFYLLLVGTGVGFRCTQENASKLPPVRTDYTLLHSEYKPVIKSERLEHTKVNIMDNGYAKIYIGDSKEGWVEALKLFLNLITNPTFEHIKHIKISYNSIRPKGERLVTFGGTASGYIPMMEMFDGIDKVLKNQIDPNLAPLKQYYASPESPWKHVRPIHILDIGNLIGNNVVVGGVRRTAEIFLADADDWECILAKYGINGIWDEEKHKNIIYLMNVLDVYQPWMDELKLNDANCRPLHHRRMSNNSIAFEKQPSKEMLDLIFQIMQGEGEPGFINMEAAHKRRPNCKGINPCAEVLLDSYGVCNLTTVNVVAFCKPVDYEEYVKEGYEHPYELDFRGLAQAQALSTRAGLRMTCIDLELPHWNEIQKRDRLIGTSLTGWQDAMEMLHYTEEQEEQLLGMLSDVVNSECIRYCHILRIPTPLLDTTVKPEGTLSQIAGGVSSGLHVSHAPYFIRRIRINSSDPLLMVAKELGWHISPEVGQTLESARTLVIDFPIKSNSNHTREEQTIEKQFDTYFKFQQCYTSHNSSNTISVKPDDWNTAKDIIWDMWDEFVGVSFLAYDGGSYPLAPYEEITKEVYDLLKSKMKPFDPDLLLKYEHDEMLATEDGMESCESGSCPIR